MINDLRVNFDSLMVYYLPILRIWVRGASGEA